MSDTIYPGGDARRANEFLKNRLKAVEAERDALQRTLEWVVKNRAEFTYFPSNSTWRVSTERIDSSRQQEWSDALDEAIQIDNNGGGDD